MLYDGQNLEAESEEELTQLMQAFRALGDVAVTENEDCHTLEVSSYKFIMQQGELGWITVTGLDENSDEKLYDLYIACGGEPESDDQ